MMDLCRNWKKKLKNFLKCSGEQSHEGSLGSPFPCLNIIAFAPFVEMNKDLIQLFKSSANSLGLSNNIMDSGAGHDTAQLSRVVPAGMIFIPCKDGLSHCPEEYAEASDISKGTAVLWKVVEKLAFQNINKT